VTLLWILAAFLAFMVLLRGVNAVDDYAAARYGYAPFAMPNLLFMLIPHGLLLFAIRSTGDQIWILLALAGAALLGMLLLLWSRTSAWIALFAAPVSLLLAPVLVLSLLFRILARAGGEGGG
jgi:hypothetical protein